MGGTDPTGCTPLVIEALRRLGLPLDVTVVSAPATAAALAALADTWPAGRLRVTPPVPDLPGLMAAADVIGDRGGHLDLGALRAAPPHGTRGDVSRTSASGTTGWSLQVRASAWAGATTLSDVDATAARLRPLLTDAALARTARRCGPSARRRPRSMAGRRGVGGREVRLGSPGRRARGDGTTRGHRRRPRPVGMAERPRDAGGVAPPRRRTPRGPPDVAARHPPARRPAPARGLGRRRRRRDGPLGPRGRPGVGGVDHRRRRGPRAWDWRAPCCAPESSGSQESRTCAPTWRSCTRPTKPSRRLFVSGGYAPDLPADVDGVRAVGAHRQMRSQVSGVPRSTSWPKRRPATVSKASVGSPPAGRMERTFCAVTGSPARTSATT